MKSPCAAFTTVSMHITSCTEYLIPTKRGFLFYTRQFMYSGKGGLLFWKPPCTRDQKWIMRWAYYERYEA